MGKNRHWSSLGMVAIVCAIGLLVGRSQAQPEKVQKSGSPIFLKIGNTRINLNQIYRVDTINNSHLVTVWTSAEVTGCDQYVLGKDGVAEALLEWMDAHSVDVKPKRVEKK